MAPLTELALALRFAARLFPATKALIKASRKDSPGGKKITARERERIIRKLFPVLEDAIDDLAGVDFDGDGE